jgi:hypothetical protein
MVVEVSQNGIDNWRLIAFRETFLDGSVFNSIYRTFGALDRYTRITVLNLDISPAQTGFLFVGSLANADLSGILQAIFASLGDNRQPVNSGQSIYHLLAQIDATLDTNQPNLAQILSILNTYQPAINSNVSQLATTNARLTSIETQIIALVNGQNAGIIPLNFDVTIAAGSTWQAAGAFLNPTFYIVGVMMAYSRGDPASAGAITANVVSAHLGSKGERVSDTSRTHNNMGMVIYPKYEAHFHRV